MATGLVIADEAFTGPESPATLVDLDHGITVNLVRSGGLAAFAASKEARRHDLSVMLGSTLESWLDIAAAHLAPLVDHVALGGNLLLANDPLIGCPIEYGRAALGAAPGLGVA